MNNITDWIKDTLTPSLYEVVDKALPELKFNRFTGGWRSSLKLDLSNPKEPRQDKTVVTKQRPQYLLEQGEPVVSIVTYVMNRDGVDFITAVKKLADITGVKLPSSDYETKNYNYSSDYDIESHKKYKERATLLEEANSFFIDALQTKKGTYPLRQSRTDPPAHNQAQDYYKERGYSIEDIKAMELGLLYMTPNIYEYLKTKGYTQEQIDEALNIKQDTRMGTTHRLTIPYRSGGVIKGFKFRSITGEEPKYLNSKGLDKIGGFFNLLNIKGDKDIVIVEGELDSLHATVKGVENVVATGGSSINPEQVRDAIKRGAKSFTICLDNEPGKEETTVKNNLRAIEVILGEGVNRVYIVTLPDLGDGKTDPDRLIKEKGVESFKTAIAQALPYYEYQLRAILHPYGEINKTRDLTAKEIDKLQDQVVETATKLDAVDRDRYKKIFLNLGVGAVGITEESISITLDRLTSTRDKEAQAKELKKLLTEVTALQDKGETEEAIKLLDKQSKQIKATTGKGLLPTPMSFTTLLDEIATTPASYKTGYSSLDSFIGFTPGAISLIAGRPSHGKTTLLFNLLLEMSKLYQDKSFYFFTYEEPVKNLSIKLINRLTATDLSGYFRDYRDLAKPTNYEFIKAYIRNKRTDIREVEEGKRLLQDLIDSQRIKVIDKNYSVEELYSLIAYVNKTENIGGVFIDYIQRMRTERRTQDKRTEIAHISDQVLQIAKDSGLPIILGAQLNRATTTGATKKPTLENLKEAGNLEEDANTVLSVYNESREKEETETGESYKGLQEVELEIKALKNREGEVNQTATLNFNKWTGVIKDQANSSYFK